MTDIAYDDRRGLTKSMTSDELRGFGITGLMLMDLELCRRDSEVIARDKNLPDVAEWLREGAEKAWLLRWLDADERQDRLGGLQQCADAGEWHDLSCALGGWHDDLSAMQLIYARWHADAPRRNARKKRKKTQEPGASWQRELARYLHAEGPQGRVPKYRHIPTEHEEPLVLSGGKFWVTRRKGTSSAGTVGPLVSCAFDDGRAAEEISFSTFERYLKEAPKPE